MTPATDSVTCIHVKRVHGAGPGEVTFRDELERTSEGGICPTAVVLNLSQDTDALRIWLKLWLLSWKKTQMFSGGSWALMDLKWKMPPFREGGWQTTHSVWSQARTCCCRRKLWEQLEANSENRADFLYKGSASIQHIVTVGPQRKTS